MVESSKRRKTIPTNRSHGRSHRPPPSTVSSSLFSNAAQKERYLQSFSTRDIIDPKFLDIAFFERQNFESFEIFRSRGLLDFMNITPVVYPDLVKVFYSNLEIRDGIIYSEVKKIPMVIDESLFYTLTKLSANGTLFEGVVVDEWKEDYSSLNARQMVCLDNANLSGRLLAGCFKFDYRIMHYIIFRILLPRSTNLAQATEEDLILMWALLTGREINWAHLI